MSHDLHAARTCRCPRTTARPTTCSARAAALDARLVAGPSSAPRARRPLRLSAHGPARRPRARVGRHSGRARLHAAVLRVPRPRTGARRSGSSRGPLRAAAGRPGRVRGAQPDPVPRDRGSRARLGAALRCRRSRSRVRLYKRITLVVEACRIAKVFYPVFPPDKNVDEVIAWLARADEARHVRRRQGRASKARSSELDVPTMREYFERGGADETGSARARRRAAARADRPEEVLPHRRQLPRARGGLEARRLVARDRAVDRLLPERRRDRRAGRADRLSRAPDAGARLRARAGRRRQEGRASGSRRRRRRTTSAAT